MLTWVGFSWAVVIKVRDPIAVSVLASVADSVAVAVELVRIRNVGAVVVEVFDTVTVRVATLFAGVTDAVAVRIFLAGVRHVGAVVIRVKDTVCVAVGSGQIVAGVANAVTIGVFLTGICVVRTVVISIIDSVAVTVSLDRIFVTDIADAVFIRILLPRVEVVGAVVVEVIDTVFIRVGPDRQALAGLINTVPAVLNQTIRGTAVVGVSVAIVALLIIEDRAVTALRKAERSAGGLVLADPTVFDFACCVAAIARVGVSVVTCLGCADERVAADVGRNVNTTGGRAAVAVRNVAIVTFLAGVHGAVTTDAGLDRADCRATVAAGNVSVVTLFANVDSTVAAYGASDT
ncbi:MAG: hypothetical protein ACJAYU_000487, partial [Bradymonadia bacterium]